MEEVLLQVQGHIKRVFQQRKHAYEALSRQLLDRETLQPELRTGHRALQADQRHPIILGPEADKLYLGHPEVH